MTPTEISDALQYFTLPVELIGFTLALIEIRFPVFASRLSKIIVKTEKRSSGFNPDLSKLAAIASVCFFLSFGVAIVLFQIPEWLVYGGCGVVMSFGLGHTIAARWIPNRAIGTIGLIMAALGLLGELYQIWVQVFI